MNHNENTSLQLIITHTAAGQWGEIYHRQVGKFASGLRQICHQFFVAPVSTACRVVRKATFTFLLRTGFACHTLWHRDHGFLCSDQHQQ
jgi:hypothetical protein